MPGELHDSVVLRNSTEVFCLNYIVVFSVVSDDKPQPQQQSRSRYSVIAFVGGILGSSLTIFLIYCFGGESKSLSL